MPKRAKYPLSVTNPELLAEWDYDKNEITPDKVSKGSDVPVWWRCPKGHGYESVVYSRVGGCGCPYCTGRKPYPGETDLATLYPEIAKEWDCERNSLTPSEVTPGSHKKVWWLCDKGHSYCSAPYTRTSGSGCPYCANRKVLKGFNDLATTHPYIALEWHRELNAPLTPEDVTYGSTEKIWWRCSEGHAWKAQVFSRTREKASGCPICAGTVKISSPVAPNEAPKIATSLREMQ